MLQKDYDMYGADSFETKECGSFSERDGYKMEIFLMKLLKTQDERYGYNYREKCGTSRQAVLSKWRLPTALLNYKTYLWERLCDNWYGMHVSDFVDLPIDKCAPSRRPFKYKFYKFANLPDGKRRAGSRPPFEIARRIGISSGCIVNWEYGKREPSRSEMKIITEYFNTPLEYFMED